jgi:hypothetical protein
VLQRSSGRTRRRSIRRDLRSSSALCCTYDMTKDDQEHPTAVPVPKWIQPPRDEIPCSIDVELLLGVSVRAAVYIARPASYANGLLFDMVAVDQAGILSGQRFLGAVDSQGASGVKAASDEFLLMQRHSSYPISEHLPGEFLCLGIEFADGRRVSNREGPPSIDSLDSPPKIALTNLGAGNRFRRYAYCRYDWYLWPLPAIGDLVFVCEWTAFGIAESRATMDGDAVRKASMRAHGAWDARVLPE